MPSAARLRPAAVAGLLFLLGGLTAAAPLAARPQPPGGKAPLPPPGQQKEPVKPPPTTPPAGEEEEEKKPGPAKKPVPVEGDPNPGAPAGPKPNDPLAPGNNSPVKDPPPANPPATPATPPAKSPMPGGTPDPEPVPEGEEGGFVYKLDDLVRAAQAPPHAGLKPFFAPFAVAFDRLTDNKGKTVRITPVPLLFGKDKYPAQFGVVELDDANQPKEPRGMTVKTTVRILPFEQIVIEAVTDLLKPSPFDPKGPKPADKLAAAERALTAVMFFHESAREQNRRRGKSWDKVKADIYEKLTGVRVDQIKQAATDQDWAKVRALAARMTALYRNNPAVLEPVYAARLAEAEGLVKSDRVGDLERGRELLNEYDARFPSGRSEIAAKVRAALVDRAKKLIAEAQRMAGQDKAAARNLLQSAEAIDPTNPGTRGLQQELRTEYPTLVVGTRRLPELMSPARARFDSEKQATELLFEPLLESLPDDTAGVTYRPALAAGRPTVLGGARDVELVRSAGWGMDGRGAFTLADLTGTFALTRQSPYTWSAAPFDWLADPGLDAGDDGRVRVRFKIGHVDPRELLTFKLLPAGYLLQQNKRADDLEFARRPFGTGPFRLSPDYRPRGPGEPARDVVFVVNPGYGRRPGRMGQPFIKEVRYTDLADKDPVAEVRAGRIHVVTDVPTGDLPRYTADNNLNGKARVVTAAPSANRRVHMLAINHRRPAFQSADFRRGISQAIDREKILTEVFRAGKPEFHKPLTGPFPPNTWAVPKPLGGTPQPLYSRDQAEARLRTALTDAAGTNRAVVTLIYPDDEPTAKAACEKIKGMVEDAAKGSGRPFAVTLEAVPPAELYHRVQDSHTYDLAYLPFDYPDAWFPLGLGSLLDPAAAGPNGRNIFGYLTPATSPTPADDELGRLLQGCRAHRDPAQLTKLAHEAHRKFNDVTPFVPLWQLDRHSVFATGVKVFLDGRPEEVGPRVLNPTELFTSVGRWRVE